MNQTLLFIPHEIMGLPVFGFGWLLILWAVAVVIWLGTQYRRFGWGRETRDPIPFLLVAGAAIVYLFPRLEIQAPDGTPLGLPIRGYGFFMLLAVVAGWGLSVWRGAIRGLSSDTIASLGITLILAGVVGARLFFVIEYWEQFRRPTWGATIAQIAKFTEGGLVVYGSLIGGFIAYVWFAKRRGIPLLALGDIVAPGVMLGMAIGRIGCLMNGCCYGGLCTDDALWSIQFPRYSSIQQQVISPPYSHQLSRGQLHGFNLGTDDAGRPLVTSVIPGSMAEQSGLTAGVRLKSINGFETGSLEAAEQVMSRAGPQIAVELADGQTLRWNAGPAPERSLPVHPTQVYSAISGFLICLVMLAAEPYINRDGGLFALFLTLYPIARSLEEIIRVDEPGQLGTSLTIAQWVSLGVFAIAVVSWSVVIKRPPGLSRLQAVEPRAD